MTLLTIVGRSLSVGCCNFLFFSRPIGGKRNCFWVILKHVDDGQAFREEVTTKTCSAAGKRRQDDQDEGERKKSNNT